MNAGGRHGEIGAVVRYVDVMTSEGDMRRLRHNEIGFGYRTTALGKWLIVGAGSESLLCGLPPLSPGSRRLLELRRFGAYRAGTQPPWVSPTWTARTNYNI